MMRAFYIIGMVISLSIPIASVVFALAYSAERHSYWNSYDYYSGDDFAASMRSYEYGYARAAQVTVVEGAVMLALMAYFLMTYIVSLVRIKTRTMLVFGILGLVFTGLCLIIPVIMVLSPRDARADEAGFLMIPYGILMLAFTIVGTIHAFRTRT